MAATKLEIKKLEEDKYQVTETTVAVVSKADIENYHSQLKIKAVKTEGDMAQAKQVADSIKDKIELKDFYDNLVKQMEMQKDVLNEQHVKIAIVEEALR